MNESERDTIRERVRKRTRELREKIGAKALVTQGSLHTRTKVCGRKNCACATDESRRHGPYHEWARLESGRMTHTILSAEQADLMAEAIANYRDIQALLERWQRETLSAVLGLSRRKGNG